MTAPRLTDEQTDQTIELAQGLANNIRGVFSGFEEQGAAAKKKWLRDQGIELRDGQSTADFALAKFDHPWSDQPS